MRAHTLILAALLATPLAAQQRAVVVNRVRLPDQQVRDLETRWSVQVRDGRYWYDAVSGAWGMDGGPTAGWILPGLTLGGGLPPDASNGATGVFINGRQLPDQDGLPLRSFWSRAGQTVVNGAFLPPERHTRMNRKTPDYVREHLRQWQNLLDRADPRSAR